LASSTATRSSISLSTLVELCVAGAVLEVGGDRFESQQRGRLERAGQKTELALVQSVEGAACLTARRRRSTGSSIPCSAIKASIPPTVRNAAAGLAVGGVLASDSANGPPLARRAVAGAEARAVPFGPLTRMPAKVGPYG
jgi:hypothetical protein